MSTAISSPILEGIGTFEHYLDARGLHEQPSPLQGPLLASIVDRTLLKPDSPQKNIEQIGDEAVEHQFKSVCVNPTWVEFVSKRLAHTGVKVCTVIGFPLGANTTTVKAFETIDAIQRGAEEIDMVINIGALKSGDTAAVLADMEAVVNASAGRAVTKAIIETGLLTDDEKVLACELALTAGIDYVKTSTGFVPLAATPEDVCLMRGVVGDRMGVKASGGIRSVKDLERMVAAGATRIGTGSPILDPVEDDPDAY